MAIAVNFNSFLTRANEVIAEKFSADVATNAMRDRTLISDFSTDFDQGHTAEESVALHTAEIAVLYA